MAEFKIRPMHSRDILSVQQLHVRIGFSAHSLQFIPHQAALLPVPYALSFFLHLLVQPTRVCLVALAPDKGNPVAFISAAMHPEQRIEILTLGVLATFRHCKIATRLVHTVIDTLAGSAATAVDSTTVFAQVSASDEPAKRFYRHMGMHPTDFIRDMYRNLPCGSRDAYVVSGRIAAAER